MALSLHRAADLGRLARDFAVSRFPGPWNRQDRARQRLIRRLGLMHGLPQKIGQLLALPEMRHSDSAYASLTEGAPAMPASEALREIGRALAACPGGTEAGGVAKVFRRLDPQGIAASLGQVHRAELMDGTRVAVKVQFPGILDAVDTDLRALGWLTAPVGDLRRGFDVKAYRSEIGGMLRSELDYGREAECLERFHAAVRHLPVEVPEVIREFSGPRLLTMTWIEGERLAAAARWPSADRERVARVLAELFLGSLLDWGHLHADPHPGNYRFRRESGVVSVGLLDFGCVKEVPVNVARSLRELMLAGREGALDEIVAHEAFAGMGFNMAALRRLAGRLGPIARLLVEPFVSEQPLRVTDWRLGERLTEVLGDDRRVFRTAGPAELIYILRAWHGLLHQLKVLDVPVPWREIWNRIEVHRTREAIGGDRNWAADESFEEPCSAETLRLRIEHQGRESVDLSFPARCIHQLVDLMPPGLPDRLRSRGWDIHAMIDASRRRGHAPGELFACEEDGRRVRVWLT